MMTTGAAKPISTQRRVITKCRIVSTKTKATTTVTTSRSRSSNGILFVAAIQILFAIFFLAPLILLQLLLMTHDRYIQPYLTTFVRWNEERVQTERTFPYFLCPEDVDIVTERSASGLYVNESDSIEETVDKMLHHGAAIFPKLFDTPSDGYQEDSNVDVPRDGRELLHYVREYTLWKNQRLDKTIEGVSIIKQNHRWSFGLDVRDYPDVLSEVLRRLTTTNPVLQSTLEELLGPDPAVVELSTITVEEGAEEQYFHQDIRYQTGPITFGRSFAPLYTLLIPLQDTVTSMGSTWIAPGTQYCAGGGRSNDGFPVAGAGIWNAGDGLLYNGHVRHRGGAHTMGPERVTMIISFAKRPTGGVLSLPLGSIYGIRFDHWGFTWNDLQDPVNTILQGPLLTELGIRKGGTRGWTWLQSLATVVVGCVR